MYINLPNHCRRLLVLKSPWPLMARILSVAESCNIDYINAMKQARPCKIPQLPPCHAWVLIGHNISKPIPLIPWNFPKKGKWTFALPKGPCQCLTTISRPETLPAIWTCHAWCAGHHADTATSGKSASSTGHCCSRMRNLEKDHAVATCATVRLLLDCSNNSLGEGTHMIAQTSSTTLLPNWVMHSSRRVKIFLVNAYFFNNLVEVGHAPLEKTSALSTNGCMPAG